MKKIVFILSVAVLSIFTSCGSLSKASTSIQPIQQIANVAGTASELTGVLTKTLGLNSGQGSSLTSILSNFITGTNGISSITNMAKYASKLKGLTGNTLGSLKTLLSVGQYANLLKLGSGGSSNIVNNLVGGKNLSSGAISVLGGLLGNI